MIKDLMLTLVCQREAKEIKINVSVLNSHNIAVKALYCPDCGDKLVVKLGEEESEANQVFQNLIGTKLINSKVYA